MCGHFCSWGFFKEISIQPQKSLFRGAYGMPDLITHLAIAYLSNKWLRIIRYSTLLYVGTILPDLLAVAPVILFPGIEYALYPFHTPVGSFILCLLISFSFDEKFRAGAFVSLLAGCFLHLLLDLLQKHIQPAYTLLFPFSWKRFELGILLPDTIVRFMPMRLLVILLIELLPKLIISRKQQNQI